MIEVFGFNTTKGGAFEMHNTTVEDIKTELHKKFPNWSDAVIDKVVSNKSYYKEVIPVDDGKKKKVKRGSIAKESICINGYELNPILNLGQSIHSYRKNAYRYWGNIASDMLNTPNIGSKYNDFDKSFDDVVEAIKSTPRASKSVITTKVLTMCTKMEALKSAFDKSGLLNQDTDKEYINGTGRKLGMGELMKRVGELSEECNKSLH